MRNALFIAMAGLMTTSGSALATNVTVRLEVRGLGSRVPWSNIAGGFILDVYLDAEVNMEAAQFALTGDSRFQHAGTVRGGGQGILNYESDQGWDRANGFTFAAGSLPLPGALLGTIADDTSVGAWSGRFAWLEFTAVPPDGSYEITIGPDSTVGDIEFKAMTISVTPLRIIGSSAGSGGGGGAGGGSEGDDGAVEDGDDGGSGDDIGDDGGGEDGDGSGGVTPDDGSPDDSVTDGDGGAGGSGPGDGASVDDDGGQEQGTPSAPPFCAAGVVESACLSLLVLYMAQRRRRG